MSEAPQYEVYAIRYARRDAERRDHFLMGDPHNGPMPMDYFVWVAVGPDGAVVVDAGFTEETAKIWGREFLRCPVEALRLIGVDPDAVRHVVITHVHYDHVGNFHRFPAAEIHLQEAEMHYVTGRHMRHEFLRHPFTVEDVVRLVQLNFEGRVRLYTGPAEIAPGISVHPVGGHSVGLQYVKVNTQRGTLILASDTTHFYENLTSRRPFPAVVNVPVMFDAFDELEAVAPSPDHIVPGHDPEVMRRYPAPSKELEGIVVRLDVPPTQSG